MNVVYQPKSYPPAASSHSARGYECGPESQACFGSAAMLRLEAAITQTSCDRANYAIESRDWPLLHNQQHLSFGGPLQWREADAIRPLETMSLNCVSMVVQPQNELRQTCIQPIAADYSADMAGELVAAACGLAGTMDTKGIPPGVAGSHICFSKETCRDLITSRGRQNHTHMQIVIGNDPPECIDTLAPKLAETAFAERTLALPAMNLCLEKDRSKYQQQGVFFPVGEFGHLSSSTLDEHTSANEFISRETVSEGTILGDFGGPFAVHASGISARQQGIEQAVNPTKGLRALTANQVTMPSSENTQQASTSTLSAGTPLGTRDHESREQDDGSDSVKLQQRSRTCLKRGTACVRCREKKYKCTGERNGCGNCVKRKTPKCVYQTMAKRTSRKPRLQSKLQELENQIAEKEAKLVELEKDSARQISRTQSCSSCNTQEIHRASLPSACHPS